MKSLFWIYHLCQRLRTIMEYLICLVWWVRFITANGANCTDILNKHERQPLIIWINLVYYTKLNRLYSLNFGMQIFAHPIWQSMKTRRNEVLIDVLNAIIERLERRERSNNCKNTKLSWFAILYLFNDLTFTFGQQPSMN